MTSGSSEKSAAKDSTGSPATGLGGGSGMQLIVPLQGVVQGSGGIVLGSLIPCALFYVLQLYLKRNRSPSPPPSPSDDGSWETHAISRSPSRNVLSPRGSSGHAAVSSRASSIAKSGGSPYFVGSRKCSEDPYHPIDNPDGVIQLGLAENHLSLDLIGDWLAKHMKDSVLNEQRGLGGLSISRLAAYQPFDGLMELKMGVAGFMGQAVGGSVSFDPSQIVLTAGATPAIEILSFCLADPGNAFLVPSPYYPGYDRNMRWRAGIELIPVPCRSMDNFVLNIALLERSYNQAKKRGVKVRAILFSNPSNPVGNLLSRETLHDLIDFATEKNIHVIADEVFAASTYGNEEFVSIAEVMNTHEFDMSRIHIIYGLSKDLSIPGFRIGLIYSFNEHLLAAASKLSRFSSVSVPTQHLVISMLTDTKFITEYIKMNRERLRVMYELLVNGLQQLGIECAKSSGGFYCWADMSKFMKSYSEKGEFELWKDMLNLAKIHATPGLACHCIEPGWFRLCFTTLTQKDIPVVIERIKRVTYRH
ncbi:putative aminotransferase ACS12 [Canna indica]|uniref:Aminotransferase ACS12 n=1 Tax=Canna indica TaxID=4628 RepID=A0AAQ3KG32_9LILI|nr:putative aminotransferase ACS12 [Canna indica]